MNALSALDADVALARSAVLEAGAAVAGAFGGEQEVRLKSPGQPVTPADLAAEEVLRARLAGERPAYGWLSEESVDDPVRLSRRRAWVVDPIDGTRSFIAGRPEFAVSVALVEDGLPVLGFVLNPATGELFWAARGGGAWLERTGGSRPPVAGSPDEAGGARRLRVRRPPEGAAPVLLASRSELEMGELRAFTAAWRVEPTGSTAYKMARVAAGEGDGFVSRGPKSEWDVCGAHILVEEAGGRVSDLRGDPLTYNRPDPRVYGILTTAGPLHDALLERVRGLAPHPRLPEDAD